MRTLVLAVCLLSVPVLATEPGRVKEPDSVPLQLAASESRTRADVGRAIDQKKGSFYALYVRALRQKPGLQGTITLSFSIAPDGRVTKCVVASSTLNNPEFEKGIVERFLSINFGVKGTKAYSDPAYPLSFFAA